MTFRIGDTVRCRCPMCSRIPIKSSRIYTITNIGSYGRLDTEEGALLDPHHAILVTPAPMIDPERDGNLPGSTYMNALPEGRYRYRNAVDGQDVLVEAFAGRYVALRYTQTGTTGLYGYWVFHTGREGAAHNRPAWVEYPIHRGRLAVVGPDSVDVPSAPQPKPKKPKLTLEEIMG